MSIAHTTIAHNSGGNGMQSAGGSSIYNSIVYGNDGDQLNGTNISVTTELSPSFSWARWCLSGFGNINENPRFVNPEESDFSLGDFSPAIGSAFLLEWMNQDLYLDPRPAPSGSNPDMGAIEECTC